MRQTDALILLAKAPVPGGVKTRLCPPLTPAGAAAFYACLLEDTAAEMARVADAHRFLFHAPPAGRRFFRGGSYSRFELLPQSGRDLGERMENAFAAAFGRGFARVVLVGADCPVLTAARVRSALRELGASARAVFGPSRDGGFYLVALSTPAPSLFRGTRWGTASVLASVVSRCRDAGLPYALLSPGFDVDTAADLSALRDWAGERSSPACPRTRRWLTAFGGG